MELGSVHEYINMWLLLAHSSLHQLEFMSLYGLLCISAELELGIIRVKIHSNQTMGMFHSYEGSKICTMHEIVTFDRNARKWRDVKSNPDPTKGNLYYVPTRNPRMGRLEVNTLPKKDFYSVQIKEVGPQHNYVHYRKPKFAGHTSQ